MPSDQILYRQVTAIHRKIVGNGLPARYSGPEVGKMRGDRRHHAIWQLAWGIILVITGLLLLLDRFYIFDLAQMFHLYWPLILIAVGITKLLCRRTGPSIDERQNNVGTASQ